METKLILISLSSYSGTDVVADVSYDMFTSSMSSGSAEFEIMIWLAALGGAGPISSTGSPIATPTIAGTTWNLYLGPNGKTTIYSFVASSKVTSFSVDLLEFYTYLLSNEGFSTSQYGDPDTLVSVRSSCRLIFLPL
jgi:xyloglucan-specific endo-beta-1,4-glucanase